MKKQHIEKFKEIVEKYNPDLEVYLGKNNKQANVRDINNEKFLEDIMKWGKRSNEGLCCGIFGCTETVTNRCIHCKGGYCGEHIKLHFHSADNDGIILRDVEVEE